MFVCGNCGFVGELMIVFLVYLLVLVYLKIFNWLVVNSFGLWNKGLYWIYLYWGIDGDF